MKVASARVAADFVAAEKMTVGLVAAQWRWWLQPRAAVEWSEAVMTSAVMAVVMMAAAARAAARAAERAAARTAARAAARAAAAQMMIGGIGGGKDGSCRAAED